MEERRKKQGGKIKMTTKKRIRKYNMKKSQEKMWERKKYRKRNERKN